MFFSPLSFETYILDGNKRIKMKENANFFWQGSAAEKLAE